jgi:hypothetical protein
MTGRIGGPAQHHCGPARLSPAAALYLLVSLTGGVTLSVISYLRVGAGLRVGERPPPLPLDFRDFLTEYGILGLQIGRGDPLFSVFHLKLELHHVRLSVGGRNPRFSRPVRRWSLWEGSSSFS